MLEDPTLRSIPAVARSEHLYNDAPEFLFELLNTITFTEHAGKTRVEVRSQLLRTTMLGAPYAEGMETGWVESLERLAAVVTQK